MFSVLSGGKAARKAPVSYLHTQLCMCCHGNKVLHSKRQYNYLEG